MANTREDEIINEYEFKFMLKMVAKTLELSNSLEDAKKWRKT